MVWDELCEKRRYNCGVAGLSQRHLLCKRQYNCGNKDLSQRHLLCKREYNCGDTDLSQRHLLCKRQYNCGDTDLSHRHLFCKCQNNGGDKPAAATAATIRAAAPSGSSVYCACHTKSSRGHCGDNPRRSSFSRLCVLRLPHKEQPRPLQRQSAPELAPATRRAAAATPATICAAAPSGGSVYCACHTKSSRGHCSDNPRRSSFRRLCVLRLPHKEQPRPLRRQSAPQLLQEALCTAPAAQRAAAATPATIRASSFRKLCVLRLPHEEQTGPLRRQSAPQLLQDALCTAPATQRAAAATPATIRAATPSGRSVYCACL